MAIPILEPSQLALDHHECALSQGHSTPLPFPSGPAHRILSGCFAHSEKDKQLVDIPHISILGHSAFLHEIVELCQHPEEQIQYRDVTPANILLQYFISNHQCEASLAFLTKNLVANKTGS
jgi:hypothetical protein